MNTGKSFTDFKDLFGDAEKGEFPEGDEFGELFDANLFGATGLEQVKFDLQNLNVEEKSESDELLEKLIARLPGSSDKIINVLDLEPALAKRFLELGGLDAAFRFFEDPTFRSNMSRVMRTCCSFPAAR